MALAILELIEFDENGYDLSIDTGTNTHFELKLGESVARRAGMPFVDQLFHQTRLTPVAGAGDLLAPPQQLKLPPVDRAPGTKVYAQLFTCKAGRRAAAWSDVIDLPPLGLGERRSPRGRDARYRPASAKRTFAQSMQPMTSPAQIQAQVRRIPYSDFAAAKSVSLDSILAEVLRIAQPVVADVLKKPNGGGGAGSPGDIVAGLLRAVLGAVAPAPQADQQQQQQVKSETKSLDGGNRFARPFVFGIDDALIGAAVGQLVQVLPQLANAANQRDKDRRTADQAFITKILGDINQRMLLDRAIEAQRQSALQAANANGSGAVQVNPEDLAKLAAMIGQVQPPPQSQTPPPSQAKSLSRATSVPAPAAAPAARAVLEPMPAAPLDWIGGADPVYARAGRIALRFRFTVAKPAPAKALARALLKVTLVDDSNPKLRFEKTVKLTAVAANSELECVFEPGELAHMPTGSRLTATGALRWPGKNGAREALGSTQLVLVGPLFVKALGGEVGGERELVDMRRWRPFWNKVWDAPTLDRNGEGKARWKFEADVRYVAKVGVDARNGIMETRHKPPRDAPDNDYQMTAGRLKAGIEIGVPQLAALRSLWDIADPVPQEMLAAFADRAFLAQCGGEAQRRIELKGRAGERGHIWMIPTFRLFEVALGRVSGTDATGRVTTAADEKARLPLPVGVRVLALRSE